MHILYAIYLIKKSSKWLKMYVLKLEFKKWKKL